MKTVANLLTAIIAIEHLGILVLEMFFWDRPVGRRIFGMTPEVSSSSAVLAMNQGLYNGFLAVEKNYVVESYEDKSEGHLGNNEDGQLAMTEIALRPKTKFSGDDIPTCEQIAELHHPAHEKCFIASSVKTKIDIESIEPK